MITINCGTFGGVLRRGVDEVGRRNSQGKFVDGNVKESSLSLVVLHGPQGGL